MTTTKTLTFRSAQEKYETYAAIETQLGNDAWNAGDYHRATRLWRLAASWAQAAAKAAKGGATQ